MQKIFNPDNGWNEHTLEELVAAHWELFMRLLLEGGAFKNSHE